MRVPDTDTVLPGDIMHRSLSSKYPVVKRVLSLWIQDENIVGVMLML